MSPQASRNQQTKPRQTSRQRQSHQHSLQFPRNSFSQFVIGSESCDFLHRHPASDFARHPQSKRMTCVLFFSYICKENEDFNFVERNKPPCPPDFLILRWDKRLCLLKCSSLILVGMTHVNLTLQQLLWRVCPHKIQTHAHTRKKKKNPEK